jgi:hypothetical protein
VRDSSPSDVTRTFARPDGTSASMILGAASYGRSTSELASAGDLIQHSARLMAGGR